MNNNIISLTQDNFDTIVFQEDKPVFVDFWAEWCNPCKLFLPILTEISEEYQQYILVTKVNVDDASDLVSRFEIQSIPTLLLFKNKKIISKNVGIVSKSDIKKILKTKLDII